MEMGRVTLLYFPPKSPGGKKCLVTFSKINETNYVFSNKLRTGRIQVQRVLFTALQ